MPPVPIDPDKQRIEAAKWTSLVSQILLIVQLGVYTTLTDELKTENVVFIDAVLVLFAMLGLSTVTWTLQELGDGKVNLHLEQTGLSNEQALGGAKYGWSKWCGKLEKAVAQRQNPTL